MSEHFVNKTDTPAAEKDLWQTPKELFDAINKEFDFDVDIFASEDNKLAPCFFNEEYSALTYEWNEAIGFDEWHRIDNAFANPPYSQTHICLTRAAQQAKKHNITVVALVNANTDTKWFSDAVKSANEVRLLTGRIGFVKPDGKKASGNPKGQCLIIWRGNCKTPCQISMVDRNELIKGQS